MKTLVSLDPMLEFNQFSEMIDRMFNGNGPSVEGPTMTLPIEVTEKDGIVTVRAAAPGIKPEDIDVSIEKDMLTIRGEVKQDETHRDAKIYRREWSYGTFTRTLKLPADLAIDKVEARVKDGFVTVTIPRALEAKPNTVKVPVLSD